MKKGDWVNTPRFLKVKIEEVFENRKEAWEQGYHEPTHYESLEFDIFGKHTAINYMIFAAVRKN
jgi:hypothetical protein